MKTIKTNTITFKTPFQGLIDVAPPVPAAQMIPEWFQKLSMDIQMPHKKPLPLIGNLVKKFSNHTIKKCPAVVDYFAEGYIIPMWSDILVQRYGDEFHYETNLNSEFNPIEFHDTIQFETYPFKKNDYRRGVKFTSPWFFYTPPGWSTLFIKPQLHPQNDFTLIPGIVETDSFHQVNFPSIWHAEGDRILKRGYPFLHVIPFKRAKHKINLEYFNEQDHKDSDGESFRLRSKFTGGYRDITRKTRR